MRIISDLKLVRSVRCDRGCTAQLHWGRVQFLFTSYFPTKSENCTGCLCNGTPHTFYTPGHFLCIVQKSCLRDLTLETLCPQQENKRSFFFILHFWRSEENVPIKQILSGHLGFFLGKPFLVLEAFDKWTWQWWFSGHYLVDGKGKKMADKWQDETPTFLFLKVVWVQTL